MRIWVDLANSPHVLVLGPVIEELRRRGHELIITTRPFAQTVQLADRLGLRHTPLGRHGGASAARAVAVNLERAGLLVRHLRGRWVDLALSHNSFSQAIAARLRGIPFVTMYDYEYHRGSHLSFRLARRVLVPAVFPGWALRRFGAAGKAVRYPGLKEELYLGSFAPDPAFLETSGIPSGRTLVVVRPPGYWAPYYRGSGELFDAALKRAFSAPPAFIVFLPRVPEQAQAVRGMSPQNVLVPARALDGPNLLYHADVVISAGGTMNREAAVLGTPAYSVFEGPIGAVDRALAEQGRLHVLRRPADVEAIAITKKAAKPRLQGQGQDLVGFVTDAVLETV